MVQLQNVSKSHSCMKEKVYLRGLFHRLRALIAVNCTIVFVTGWMFHFELRYLSFWCKDCVQRYMPCKHDSQRGDQHLQVIDACLKPKYHSADSDAVLSARVGSTCYLNFLQWPQHVYQSEPMHGSIGCTKSSETQALSSPSAGTLAQYPFQRSKLHQICAQFLSGLLRKQDI
nr:uncharacterized protein LOC111998981 [Quercus suber]